MTPEDMIAQDEEFDRLMREANIRHKALMDSLESMREKLREEYEARFDSAPE